MVLNPTDMPEAEKAGTKTFDGAQFVVCLRGHQKDNHQFWGAPKKCTPTLRFWSGGSWVATSRPSPSFRRQLHSTTCCVAIFPEEAPGKKTCFWSMIPDVQLARPPAFLVVVELLVRMRMRWR